MKNLRIILPFFLLIALFLLLTGCDGMTPVFGVSVNYNANGGTGAPADNNNPYQEGATVTVLSPGNMNREGYTFTGWNTQANGEGTSYAPGATFLISANITLYAQWTGTEPSLSSMTLYLHNYPHPGGATSGDTKAAANLPMNTTAPTLTTLYHYDDLEDDVAGRRILKDGEGPTTDDLNKYQTWIYTPTTSMNINGDIKLSFWARHKDDNKQIKLEARLLSGGSVISTGYASQMLSPSWTKLTIDFPGVSQTIPAGQMITLRMYNYDKDPDKSESDANIAYDTVAYQSNLLIPLE